MASNNLDCRRQYFTYYLFVASNYERHFDFVKEGDAYAD